MYTKNTTFILGAGASFHYGYPTGEELIGLVIKKSRAISHNFQRANHPLQPKFMARYATQDSSQGYNARIRAWQDFCGECNALADKLEQINPLVIDYFLGHYPKLQEIGKLMIAWVILDCEYSASKKKHHLPTQSGGKQIQPDWLRFVLAEMLSGCSSASDLFSNTISFVTFNYDVSLEHHLYKRLTDIEIFSNEQDNIRDFLKQNIFHIYGSVRDGYKETHYSGKSSFSPDNFWDWTRDVFDPVYESATNLRVINPHTKGDNSGIIKTARRRLVEAEAIYILGYGFDESNNQRLGLHTLTRDYGHQPRAIYFTNFGDQNKINKKAGQLFTGANTSFLSHMTPVFENNALVIEKSIHDVYTALSNDF